MPDRIDYPESAVFSGSTGVSRYVSTQAFAGVIAAGDIHGAAFHFVEFWGGPDGSCQRDSVGDDVADNNAIFCLVYLPTKAKSRRMGGNDAFGVGGGDFVYVQTKIRSGKCHRRFVKRFVTIVFNVLYDSGAGEPKYRLDLAIYCAGLFYFGDVLHDMLAVF